MFKTIVFGVAIGLAGLCLASEAQAGPGPVRNGHRPVARRPVAHGSYHHRHGVRFHGGYYYRGRHHSHWSRRVWDVQYRRYHYWCPYTLVYYYYSVELDCYYPVGY
jgi:hypothetical protein